MVVNQIFENSTQTCNSINDTNEASVGYQEGPGSTFILENLPSSSGTTISATVSNGEAAQDRPCTSSAITSKRHSKSQNLTQMRRIAKKSKTVDPIVEKLKRLISRPSLEGLFAISIVHSICTYSSIRACQFHRPCWAQQICNLDKNKTREHQLQIQGICWNRKLLAPCIKFLWWSSKPNELVPNEPYCLSIRQAAPTRREIWARWREKEGNWIKVLS